MKYDHKIFPQKTIRNVAPLLWRLYSNTKRRNSCREIYLYKCECMYVCMFRHNYLSVNAIVSFPSFNWLYKYKEEYKQGEMWHCAQRAEISEKICMFQPGRCEAMGTWLISAGTNNEELLITRQRFRNHGTIDRGINKYPSNNWSRRL
jgi:hypothetical protein